MEVREGQGMAFQTVTKPTWWFASTGDVPSSGASFFLFLDGFGLNANIRSFRQQPA
jgi:hypothetical protein